MGSSLCSLSTLVQRLAVQASFYGDVVKCLSGGIKNYILQGYNEKGL